MLNLEKRSQTKLLSVRRASSAQKAPGQATPKKENPMIQRREFFALAAAVPAGALRGLGFSKVPIRKAGKVETVFESPGPKPNGLQATSAGLWIMDQGDNRAHLVRYNDGKVLRAVDTEADRASGITFDGEAIWI